MRDFGDPSGRDRCPGTPKQVVLSQSFQAVEQGRSSVLSLMDGDRGKGRNLFTCPYRVVGVSNFPTGKCSERRTEVFHDCQAAEKSSLVRLA